MVRIRSGYLRREVYLWDFYGAELYQNSGDKLSLESKYAVIFCVRKNYKGICVEKPQEIISHIWKKRDILSLRSSSRARKRVCLSSNTGLCIISWE